MGRMRIKKKSGVIPFTETLAYRMILVIALGLFFLVAVYQALRFYRADGLSPMTIALAVAALSAAAAALYNVERLKDARVSPAAMKRMKRRH
jgi:ABC-type Fe3+-siderophore transport system permease subunit